MNCIIIEDQPPAQRILKRYIEDIGSLKLEATFTDAVQAITFLQNKKVDLIFLDIHLPKMSGMDFLRALPNAPHVVLTTAFPDFALESYEYNVVDYLLKPFSFQRFVKAIAKIPVQKSNAISEKEEKTAPKELFIKSGYEHIKIPTDSILYIQSDADYTEITTENKKYLSSESLKYWSEKLNTKQFYRIHKSFIVNTTYIYKISGGQLFLNNGDKLSIGRAYKEQFLKWFLP